MIVKITGRGLIEAAAIVNLYIRCNANGKKPHVCLWGKREDLPKNCFCALREFRENFEEDSPVYFGKYLELSDFQRRVRNFTGLTMEEESPLSVLMKTADREMQGLHVFAKTSLFAIYPLWRANNREIPYLKVEELKQVPLEFPKGQTDPAETLMGKLSHHWRDQINSFLWYLNESDRKPDLEKYTKAVSWLFRAFLMGVERDALPSLLEMGEEEKKRIFFDSIKKELNK